MSCRKPVLMVIDGVSRELVEAANCGCYVEPEAPKDFADTILSYLRDPARVRAQGENGYNYAKKHFDRKALAHQYIQALDTIKKHV